MLSIAFDPVNFFVTVQLETTNSQLHLTRFSSEVIDLLLLIFMLCALKLSCSMVPEARTVSGLGLNLDTESLDDDVVLNFTRTFPTQLEFSQPPTTPQVLH